MRELQLNVPALVKATMPVTFPAPQRWISPSPCPHLPVCPVPPSVVSPFVPAVRRHRGTHSWAHCYHLLPNSLPSAVQLTLPKRQDSDRSRFWKPPCRGSRASKGRVWAAVRSPGPQPRRLCPAQRLAAAGPARTPPVLATLSALLNTHPSAAAASLAASGGCSGPPQRQPSGGAAGLERRAGAGIISRLAFPSRQAE